MGKALGNTGDAAGVAEERLSTLLELSSQCYWETDESHRFAVIAGDALQTVGFDAQRDLGKRCWESGAVPVTDGGSWEPHKALWLARRPFAEFVIQRANAQGEQCYISMSGEPRMGGAGQFNGYRGIAKDVSESKRAELLLKLEHSVARCLAEANSAGEALTAVLRAICETEGWDAGRYFRVDERAGLLRFSESWAVPDPAAQKFLEGSRDVVFRPGVGLSGIAWQSGQPVWSADTSMDPRVSQSGLSRAAGTHGAFIFPVIADGKTLGVAAFSSSKVREPDERLLEAVHAIGAQIGQFVQRKEAEERIQYMATHDSLTKLPNRVMFGQMLSLAVATAHRYQRRFAVLFVDLDRFKFVNDTLGHEAGDGLLIEIAARFSQALRVSDVVARLGGDEFVVLVQEISGTEQVAAVARKILSAAMKPLFLAGQDCRVTASIGISVYPEDSQEEQALIKNADMAMYLAKAEGKNNFQFYSEDMRTQSLARLALESSLRHALERGEFSLHYQAKLDLKTKLITGVEALLRWQHPDLGTVAPAQLIPVAEETGLIVPIGKWVLQTACAQNVAWQREGLPTMVMAVNLSARQFTDEGLLGDIAAALETTGMRPEHLELELTESMVMHNPERSASTLAAIKQMGVRLALDDFGVGYSSLAQIKRYPIDTLKVDRSFIRELSHNPEDRAITEAIIAMGRTLSLTIVAEGVETQEQQTFLTDQGCDEMQGYYFNRPVSAEHFAELLRLHVAKDGERC